LRVKEFELAFAGFEGQAAGQALKKLKVET
jgi:hypothetical protein